MGTGERWFWRALLALMAGYAAYLYAGRPGPRPADPVPHRAVGAAGEAVTREER